MIQEFVDRFMENKESIKNAFMEKHVSSYKGIVKIVIKNITEDEYGFPDPDKIQVIDHGDYQGTVLFIIGEISYQPYDYWYLKILYGSCSVCDTLKHIRSDLDEDQEWDSPPNPRQVNDYMTLALHIVQGLKKMD